MSAALSMRDAIVATIAAEIPGVAECAPHGGRFNEAEFERYTRRAPAVLVANLGNADVEDLGSDAAPGWSWAAFIVAADQPRRGAIDPLPRHDVANALAEALAALVLAQRWNDTATDTASNVRISNLYTRRGDELGIAIWAVTWTQATSTPIGVDPASLPDFLRLRTTWDQRPTDGEPPSTFPPTPPAPHPTDLLTLPATATTPEESP